MAPVVINITTLGFNKFPAVAVVAGLLSVTGGTYLLANLVAHTGRQAETGLYKEWGGRPTTQLLRTRESPSNPTQRDIWRKAITRLTDVRLLSATKEAAEPTTADYAIEAAVGQVLYLGHDPARYPVLAAALAQYGLERNLFGFRWFGRAIALFSIAGLVAAFILMPDVSRGAIIAGVVLNAALLLGWVFLPSKRRTKAASFRYAEQLLQAVVREERESSASPAAPGESTRKGRS